MASNKQNLLTPQAKELYCIFGYTKEQISERLGISEKTLYNWRREDEKNGTSWEAERKQLAGDKKGLHQNLFKLSDKLVQKLNSDLEAGVEIASKNLNAVTRLLQRIEDIKNAEEVINPQKVTENPKDRALKSLTGIFDKMGLTGFKA
jgi:transposase-like protein